MKKVINVFIVSFVFSLILFGCMKPPKIEQVVEIDTDETAYLVPLEGKTKDGQSKFMSIDYLEQMKLATKRVTIPQRERKIGRLDHEIEWIPTMRVIKVNRRPVTREWTAETDKGTSNKNESVEVESKDSIGFRIGVTMTAMVKEEDCSTFLYYFAGKPLSEIADENIRGFISSIAAREFSTRDLTKCKEDKKQIQETIFNESVENFNRMGITIANVGLVGGLQYEDPEIQTAINGAYVAEMDVAKASQETLAQIERNERDVSKAKAEREAAEEFAKAQEAMIKKTQLEIEMLKAQALVEAAKKWNGSTPANILPQGSNLLFGLDK